MTAEFPAPTQVPAPIQVAGAPALAGPTNAAPARRLGSIRRTSSLDLVPAPDGSLAVRGVARDLHTGTDGSARVTGSGLLRLTVDSERTVAALSAHPHGPALAALRGRSVAAGFRTAVWRALPAEYDAGSPLLLLLDDVSGGMVISGFTRRKVVVQGSLPPVTRRIDVCVGWAAESDAVRRLEEEGRPPPPQWNPVAPRRYAADPAGRHTAPALPPNGMRRARRLDVWFDESGDLAADVGFRDTFVDPDGIERVLHEYSARLSARDGRVATIEATAHVLPHLECPLGALSAQRVVGRPLAALRDSVSLDFFGPSTCTHLNDLLRGLSDLPALAQPLGDPSSNPPAAR